MRLAACLLVAIMAPLPAAAAETEPRLTLPPGTPAVALTFDACSGAVDHRILDLLLDEKIPATLFVTRRWLRRNGDAVAAIKAGGDLIEIENHGENHIPAITDRPSLFGLRTAGTLAAVSNEVTGGASAVTEAFGLVPRWYRDAGARYSRDAVQLIGRMGYRIAGYSVNADVGASLSAAAVKKRIVAARPGDVIIAHINHPEREAGAGVVEGIRALKARGVAFTRLDAAFVQPD